MKPASVVATQNGRHSDTGGAKWRRSAPGGLPFSGSRMTAGTDSTDAGGLPARSAAAASHTRSSGSRSAARRIAAIAAPHGDALRQPRSAAVAEVTELLNPPKRIHGRTQSLTSRASLTAAIRPPGP